MVGIQPMPPMIIPPNIITTAHTIPNTMFMKTSLEPELPSTTQKANIKNRYIIGNFF